MILLYNDDDIPNSLYTMHFLEYLRIFGLKSFNIVETPNREAVLLSEAECSKVEEDIYGEEFRHFHKDLQVR